MNAARPVRLAATLALAALGGATARALNLPLPWMIGPLLVTAGAGLAGWPVAGSSRLRNAGQWVIGSALGLYFTPPVLAQVLRLAPAIALGVAWALLLGWGFYRFLAWSQRGAVSPATAWFAAAIGGASEMAVMAERHGAQVDRVAAAHSLRVLLVVLLVPFGFQAAGLHGSSAATAARPVLDGPALAALLAATATGGALLQRWRAPNPWVLGALAAAALAAGSGSVAAALPRPLANAAQLVLAVALGSRFMPDFVRSAPRWLLAVGLGTLAMLAASAAFGAGLAHLIGLHPATGVLATAPGGIAEIAITASVLGLGAPVVTAFQVMRYVAVLTLTEPLFRRLGGGQRQSGP